MNNSVLDTVVELFNHKIKIIERRPGIYQVLAPFFHEDGDVMNIFIEKKDDSVYRICDYGKALMRLSYTFELDTSNKEQILENIIYENYANIDNGNIYIDVRPDQLYNGIMQFSQVIAKVTNMEILTRANVSNLFYDYLSEFVHSFLSEFSPIENYNPITGNDELKVDYCIPSAKKPLFMFGVKDDNKASKVIIICLQLQKLNVDFRSVIVHENMDGLTKFNRNQLTDIANKQFTTLDSFKSLSVNYIKSECL